MKLHQIIEANEQDGKSILLEAMHPYFKSLRTYYKDYYGCEPTLMITSVSNAAQYGRIVPCEEYFEALNAYTTDEDEQDVINFNSKLIKYFIR
jgi:hypothetical protein